MSLTTDGSISKYERLIAGTPYWRERKLVTSSSVRKLSFTNALPRRQLDSFCTFVACCNCSGVMIFSLTRRAPSLWDISYAPVLHIDTAQPLNIGSGTLRDPNTRHQSVSGLRRGKESRNPMTQIVTL